MKPTEIVPPRRQPLEEAWRLVVRAGQAPLTEEGKFYMIECHGRVLEIMGKLWASDVSLLRTKIAENQARFGY